MYDLTGSRLRGTLDGNHRLRGGFDRGLWDSEKVFDGGRHKRNSRLIINNRKSNRGASREWMRYPYWARSTVTGRFSRVYHTHGDRNRACSMGRLVLARRNVLLTRCLGTFAWQPFVVINFAKAAYCALLSAVSNIVSCLETRDTNISSLKGLPSRGDIRV